jgi:hypothetical protein
MNENQQPLETSASLDDIGHLFLTDVRKRHTGGAPLPVRTPPGSKAAPIPAPPRKAKAMEIEIVLAQHLNAGSLPAVRKYARQIAAKIGQVALVEIGDDGLRLSRFDSSLAADEECFADEPASPPSPEPADIKRIAAALEEVAFDVSRWLIYLPGGSRSSETGKLLSSIGRAVVLVRADDEGVVAAYRALKGLSAAGRPAMSLAVLDADDQSHAQAVYRKLAGACKQFLGVEISFDSSVESTETVAQHVLLQCRAAAGDTSHWSAVGFFVAKSVAGEEQKIQKAEWPAAAPEPIKLDEVVANEQTAPAPVEEPASQDDPDLGLFTTATAEKTEPEKPAEPIQYIPPSVSIPSDETGVWEVLDLPEAGESPAAILASIARQGSEWKPCPVAPPMCDAGTVVVGNDGRLILLAIATGNLSQLSPIALAYRWLTENRGLLSMLLQMAQPKIEIDVLSMPQLRLFIPHTQASAETLKPIFPGPQVSIHSYRPVRWGDKRGFVLNAA